MTSRTGAKSVAFEAWAVMPLGEVAIPAFYRGQYALFGSLSLAEQIGRDAAQMYRMVDNPVARRVRVTVEVIEP